MCFFTRHFSICSGHSGFPIPFEISYGSGTVKGVQLEEQVMILKHDERMTFLSFQLLSLF